LEVLIAGAGPYGVSLASHLRQRQVPFRIFGQPMRFFLDMPRGIFLKSFAFGTTIETPEHITFDRWCRERRLEDREPCKIESFTEYGLWLQKKLVPEVEPVDVELVEGIQGGFRVTLSSGERVDARRVVVAVGLRYFPRRPPVLAGLPPELVSHTSEHRSYDQYGGKDVCVIGAGQSACEAAALLHESGARVRQLVRKDRQIFHTKTPIRRSILERLRAPVSVLGAGRLNWALEHFPLGPHLLPDATRVRLTRTHPCPAGAWWVRNRVEGKVTLHTGCEILSARAEGGGLVLHVRERDKGERDLRADHVVAGTGYEVDVDRLPFLSPELGARIDRIERAPRLNRHSESSVSGLYFVGVMSTFSFGPLFRFVAGTAYTGPTLARHLARTALREEVARAPVQTAVTGRALS
jgi:pyridine nucleotide-disulfide oxidoreductase